MVVAALPSFGFYGSVSSDTEAPCLDSQVHLNSPEDTSDFDFMIRHLATGDFMGVAELEAYLPVKLGFETIFALNHGVLSTAGRDYLGNQLVVSGSERWGFPPRLTLVRGQGEAAGPDFKFPIKVTDRRGLLLINAEKSGITQSSSIHSRVSSRC
jgi:hypothetical protein